MKAACGFVLFPRCERALAGVSPPAGEVLSLCEQRKYPKKVARRSRSFAARRTPLRCSDERLGCGTRPVSSQLRYEETELRQSSPSRFAGTPFLLRYSALSTGIGRIATVVRFDGGFCVSSPLTPRRSREGGNDEFERWSHAGSRRVDEPEAKSTIHRRIMLTAFTSDLPPPQPSPARGGGSSVVDRTTICQRVPINVERPHVDGSPLQPRRATENEWRAREAGWRGLSELRFFVAIAAKKRGEFRSQAVYSSSAGHRPKAGEDAGAASLVTFLSAQESNPPAGAETRPTHVCHSEPRGANDTAISDFAPLNQPTRTSTSPGGTSGQSMSARQNTPLHAHFGMKHMHHSSPRKHRRSPFVPDETTDNPASPAQGDPT